MDKKIRITEDNLRKMIVESIKKVVSEQATYSEIEYYLGHILMDFIHDEGQKVSSTINRFLVPELRKEIKNGALNESNIDMAKLNKLIENLDKYADAIDNTYTDLYKLANEVLLSRK